ncbi:tubulin-like doman-containing protein [Methanofollis fontis]|uniref:Tubulin like n=1 Tax=Methanofollis fontis TaxID=2052832 RepID=A0A483CPJ7_9EURY|nr:tubulin-like doman-containing protein [Methanofollis fontis]TAJ44930.1 hypothetical protein CUJ86_06525 [Methanofollis fontis]
MNGERRSGASLQLPLDLTICGLGGCGKKMVGEICRMEWFLQHYSAASRHLRIYTMDTDANERFQDEKQRDEVLERVETLGGRGNVEYDALYLPNLANISQVSDLAGAEIAEKIKGAKAEPGATVWWLNDPSEEGLRFDELRTIDPFIIDDFGGGVHRRRAISKAILYKVINEGQASGFPMFSTMGTTAIVVGLGGGTGSGMFIDLARYIRGQRGETAQIWLFVVLPTTMEGEKEQLNAAVALTELEYLNQNERLFNYIVLTSLGPTGYKKGEEARVEVHEFDAVFPSIFTNVLHLEKGDINIGDAKKPFTSFMCADAHVITYPVEELRSLKGSYERIIGAMEEMTAHRKRLNGAVGDLMDEIGLKREAPPTRSEFDYIKKEYATVEKVWKNEIGGLLQYQTTVAVEFFIENNIPAELRPDAVRTFDDLADFIAKVATFSQAVKEEELKDEIDRKLFRLLPETFHALETTARIMKRIAAVEDEALHTALMETLKGREEMAPFIRDIAAARKEVTEEIRTLEGALQDRRAETEKLQEQRNRIGEKADQVLAGTDVMLDQYVTLKEKAHTAESAEPEIQQAINTAIVDLREKRVRGGDRNTWLAAAGVPDIQREISALSHEIDEDLDGLNELVETIALFSFYDMRIRRIDAGGIGSKIVGIINKRPARERKKFEALKRESEESIKANARYWNLVINAPFELEMPGDFLSRSLHRRAEDIRRRILDEVFGTVDAGDAGELATIFEEAERGRIRNTLRERLIDALLGQEEYAERYAAVEKESGDLAARLKERSSYKNALERTEDVADETFPSRRESNRNARIFLATLVEISEHGKSRGKTTKGLYTTRFGEINPRILSLLHEGSSLRDLDWDENGQRELDKLLSEVATAYKHLLDNYKLGIHNLLIPITATERWNFGKVGLVIASPSEYLSRAITSSRVGDEMRRDINDTLALRNINDSRLVTHQYARPWEITLTFVAAAGFLDNISPLIAGGGYWEIYERNRDNILHHVIRMHDGEYITRTRLMDLREAGQLSNREKKGENVSESVLGLYTVRGIREALQR